MKLLIVMMMVLSVSQAAFAKKQKAFNGQAPIEKKKADETLSDAVKCELNNKCWYSTPAPGYCARCADH